MRHRLRRRTALVLAIGVVMMVWTAPAAGQVTDQQVRAAIQRGIENLYGMQNDAGIWDDPEEIEAGHHHGGKTALATYALLEAGESYQNPKLSKAIEWLVDVKMTGVYSLSLRCHVWAALPQKFKRYLVRDTMRLVNTVSGEGTYNYTLTGSGDHSCTQYGVLGVWEGAKRNVSISLDYWEKIERRFKSVQDQSGGWSYHPNNAITGSMSAAGLTCLFITQDYLHTQDYRQVGAARRHVLQKHINLGLNWFDQNFEPHSNPGSGSWYEYYMYGVERVGLASGVKFFNGRDWYAEGAEYMINSVDGGISQGQSAFAVLFLVRGRAPVFINKLSIGDYDWNNRPRDVARVTEWVSAQVENRMNWQIVTLETPPEKWLDAPILYLAGHQALAFEDETMDLRDMELQGTIDQTLQQIAEQSPRGRNRSGASSNQPPRTRQIAPSAGKSDATSDDQSADGELTEPLGPIAPLIDDVLAAQIKRYIDLGGLLFTTADDNSKPFTRSVQNLLGRLYPQYKMIRVPKDDELYTIVYKIKPRPAMRLMGVHNGVRWLAVHSSEDLSWTFHAQQQRKPDPWRLMANLYHYASEKGRTRAKLETHFESRRRDGHGGPPVTIGRLRHKGNWNPEPLAWEMLASFAFNHDKADLTAQTLELADLAETELPMVHLTGTGKVKFSDAQINAIRKYVESGRVILLEAAGGDLEFGQSIDALLGAAFGGRTPVPLSADNPILTGEDMIDGFNCRSVKYRRYAMLTGLGQVNAARLQALMFGGKSLVLVSKEDLTYALLDQPVWGVFGYGHESAAKLTTNIALWAAALNPPPEVEEESAEPIATDAPSTDEPAAPIQAE